MCTNHRWKGNKGGRFKAKDEHGKKLFEKGKE
jgi:hypothetical protein